jgi:hypothetical protein
MQQHFQKNLSLMLSTLFDGSSISFGFCFTTLHCCEIPHILLQICLVEKNWEISLDMFEISEQFCISFAE